MEMQSVDAHREHAAKLLGSHSETRSRKSRIIHLRLYDGALRIHPQPRRHTGGTGHIAILLPLAKRIECQMSGS
jgi:hypothetical protein